MQKSAISNKNSSKNKPKNQHRQKEEHFKQNRNPSDFASDVIRTSTPIEPATKPRSSRHSRSSSLPPRRDSLSRSSRSGRSTPNQSFSTQDHPVDVSRKRRSRSSSRTGDTFNLSDSSFKSASLSQVGVVSSPDPPTFLVIEKTMGQKSMIICWTPPLLDMVGILHFA